MKKYISLNEKKIIMLSIMDYIDLFCKEHNIKYFLYGGSLIGAIRHKGYIPWDDDIDICMLRKDYDRFISEFLDEKGRYSLISAENDRNYYSQIAKVYDSFTVLEENVSGKIPIGVYIDVFPLDNGSNNYNSTCKYGTMIGLFRKIVDVKNIKLNKNRSVTKNLLLTLSKTLLFPVSKHFAINMILYLSNKIKNSKSKYVAQFTKMTYDSKEIYERNWFDKAVYVQFEDRKYCIPKAYDKVLKTEYGDYMKLPPVEKQVSHHGNEAWWKE